MPGGKIGVFTGIFRVAPTQDSLAAVIGHEVAHVTSEHSVKRARRETRNRAFVAVASSVLGARRSTADALGMGAEIGLNLPFGRRQESEADAAGLRYMSRAGFDPRASIALWKRMAKTNQNAPPAFLSTHPSSDGRLDGLIDGLSGSLMAYNEAHSLGTIPRCESPVGAAGE